MAYRKEMSKEIIRLSDTEAFAELQKVFEDMNASLLDFENKIGPLVEIIDAVNKLNMASDGQVYEVYQEIQDDKAEEERIAVRRQEAEAKIEQYEKDVRGIQGDSAALSEKKRLFGLIGAGDVLAIIAAGLAVLSLLWATLRNAGLLGAVPAVPEMIAPAWPIVLPGGAVKPAM